MASCQIVIGGINCKLCEPSVTDNSRARRQLFALIAVTMTVLKLIKDNMRKDENGICKKNSTMKTVFHDIMLV